MLLGVLLSAHRNIINLFSHSLVVDRPVEKATDRMSVHVRELNLANFEKSCPERLQYKIQTGLYF